MTSRQRARKLFKPWDDVDMGDPGGHGPPEGAVEAEIRAAVAEERGACAAILDRYITTTEATRVLGIQQEWNEATVAVLRDLAAAIRGRGPA